MTVFENIIDKLQIQLQARINTMSKSQFEHLNFESIWICNFDLINLMVGA